MFKLIGEVLLDVVYPRHCIGCHRAGSLLCQDCYCEIDFYFLPVRLQLEPSYIDDYIVVARLEGIMRKLVHQLKYNSLKELGTIAGKLLYLCSEWPAADMVTAVPLHPHRLGERGYNQAAEMGKAFAQLAQLPYHELLKRTADTPHQAQQATREARSANITENFSFVDTPQNARQVAGGHVILIDDVCTTGITLNQCAKTLKAVGCKTVTALTLAHGR